MGAFDFFKKTIKPNPISKNKQFRNSVERDMYINNTLGYRDRKDRLDYQDKLLDEVNKANEKYKQDGNLDEVIRVYEHAFIESQPPCVSSQNLKLADFYLKKGENNKAWSYLNSLISTQAAPIDKIRHEQARILKKEKRYIPATDMIMAEHLLKYSNRVAFNRDAFIKDISVCTKALKWDDEMVNDMADMIVIQIAKKDYDDAKLHSVYSAYLESKGIIERGTNGNS